MVKDFRKREEIKDEFGYSFIELMAVASLISVLFLISTATLSRIKDKCYLQSVITTFQAITSECRSISISKGLDCGIVFKEENGKTFVRIYQDGNFNGITKDDIKKGKDKPIDQWYEITKENVRISIPDGATLDPAGKSFENRDPIKFGRGDILTFTPKATATPGTLYLAESEGDGGWAIRVVGIDGRIKIYRFQNGVWEEKARW